MKSEVVSEEKMFENVDNRWKTDDRCLAIP